MQVAVSEAKAQLTELVRRVESGEEVVLTRFGTPVARIEPYRKPMRGADRLAVIERIQAQARGKLTPGPDAARAADFLYGDDGMPG